MKKALLVAMVASAFMIDAEASLFKTQAGRKKAQAAGTIALTTNPNDDYHPNFAVLDVGFNGWATVFEKLRRNPLYKSNSALTKQFGVINTNLKVLQKYTNSVFSDNSVSGGAGTSISGSQKKAITAMNKLVPAFAAIKVDAAFWRVWGPKIIKWFNDMAYELGERLARMPATVPGDANGATVYTGFKEFVTTFNSLYRSVTASNTGAGTDAVVLNNGVVSLTTVNAANGVPTTTTINNTVPNVVPNAAVPAVQVPAAQGRRY